MSPCRLRAATYVTINKCELGLSSHHGIHGNNAIGVTIKNGLIKDFEVAGIALNGGHTVTIEDMTVGPSLFSSFLVSGIVLEAHDKRRRWERRCFNRTLPANNV